MAAHNELGKWGEEIAANYLATKGYHIQERDWHSGHRDLDIIAWDGDTLVIVEVKTRRNNLFMEPEQAIDYRKRTSLLTASNHYVKSHRLNCNVRFDIISVIGKPGLPPEINHFEDIRLQ